MKNGFQIFRSNLKLLVAMLAVVSISVGNVFSQAFTTTDYKKALWLTTRFYGGQRSGSENWLLYNHLPAGVDASLKGKAFSADKDTDGYDLSGGWHDCGDHVKFGQTEFYSAYMLLKGYAEFPKGYDDYYSYDYACYKTSGDWSWEGNKHQPNGIPDILEEVKHATDYFIKCTRNSSTFYYQVGQGDPDHAKWETAVKMQTESVSNGGQTRVVYKNPNDASMPSFCGATLALMSRLYRQYDATYADLCLTHAKYAYDYAATKKWNVAGTGDGGFYSANDNAKDDYACMVSELFWATNTTSYKTEALAFSVKASPGQGGDIYGKGYGFDYSNNGDIAVYNLALLGHPDGKTVLNSIVNTHYKGNVQSDGQFNGGNASWGPLRYNANSAFIVALNQKLQGTEAKPDKFIYDNIDYILGKNSASQSFVVGFGAKSAKFPHHRNVYLNDANPGDAAKRQMTIPTKNAQFGAMVGGTRSVSQYSDDVVNYQHTEPGIDYNACLVGVLAYINSVLAPVEIKHVKPDLGDDVSLCGVGSVTLDSKVTVDNKKTFTWYLGTQVLFSASTSRKAITVSTAGTYKCEIDSAGKWKTSDEIVVSATLPAVNLGSTVELCKPVTATLDAGATGTGISYKWEKNNNLLPITSKTLTVTDAGTYKVTISASGCASQSGSVVVTSKLPVVKGDSICASGKATLQVTTSGGPFNWYADAVTSSILASGTTYQPTISATKTFYVIDGGSFGTTVGPNTYPSSAVNWGVNSGNHLKFTVLKDFTIDALKVSYGSIYGSQTDATISIEVLDANGNAFTPAKIFTSNPTSITSTQSKSLVRFTFTGFDIKKSWGNNLRLRVSSHTNIGDLNWQSGGASYPYTATDVVSITGPAGGNNNAADFMYFYNWEISSGVSCDRAAVVAVIDGTMKKCTITALSEINESIVSIYPNPFQESFNVKDLEDVQFVEIYNSFGQFMQRTSEVKELGSQLEKGAYILKIQTKDKLIVSKIVKID